MRTARILCALLSAIIGLVLCSCEKDEQAYGGEAKYTPTTTADTTATTTPADPTFRQVVREHFVANADTTAEATMTAQLDNDSLVTRELRFKLGMLLEGPSYLVVEDAEATVYTGAGRPVATEGNWTLSGKDSVKNETCVSEFSYSYYKMSVTTVNTVGKTLIGGKWVPYMRAHLSTTFHRLNSVWEEEEVVREDSIFRRERVMNEFNVTARWDGGQRTFVLSKEVVIDHFLGMVEKEEPVEEPTQTTVKADAYVKGLNKVLGAKRDLNRATKKWFDGVLAEGSEEYGSVELYPMYSSNGEETYTARTSHTVPMTVCPKGNYNGVAYLKGGIYPAYYTIDKVNMQWTYVSRISGTDAQDGFTEHKADILGIKNFQEDGTARVTPDLGFKILSEKTVNGYKVIEVLIKSYLGQWTKVTFADDALRPTGK